MLRRNPVVTGSGIICAAGRGTAAVWEPIQANRPGLGPLTLFSSPRYGAHSLGQVREYLDELTGNIRGSRSSKLIWIAAQEALTRAGFVAGQFPIDPERTGVMLGATVGGML
jgi:3-oxoacyl-(acyl-carrier-protein) synthase